MKKDSGRLIQGYADFMTIVGVVAFCLGGILVCTVGEVWILVGIGVAVIGSLITWVTGGFLRAFGELVSNSAEIVDILRKNDGKIADEIERVQDDEREKLPAWRCPKCGTDNPGWSRMCKTCMRK